MRAEAVDQIDVRESRHINSRLKANTYKDNGHNGEDHSCVIRHPGYRHVLLKVQEYVDLQMLERCFYI